MTDARTTDATPPSPRGAAALLVLLGGVMLASGLGGFGSTLAAAAYVGGTMLVWTVLLPRLSLLQPLAVFFAAHSLAAGAYWAALTSREGAMVLVGSPGDVQTARTLAFLWAVGAGVSALGVGLALDRAVRRGGARIRRALAIAAGIVLVIAPALLAAARGAAPRPIERLRAVPVVARIAAGQRVARGPMAIVRAADGSFEPVHAGNLDWLVSRGPDAVSPAHRGDRSCTGIGPDAPIEIRALPGMILYTEDGALDDPDALSIAGCAYDPTTLEQVALRASDLARPLSASERVYAVGLGALVVALVQLVLAAVALGRHARLARAREGVADGDGTVALEDGSLARCSAPKGPVLVEVDRPETEQYRVNAIASARLVAPGARAEVERAMHLASCTALVGAIGALLAIVLPLAAVLVTGFVTP